MGSVVKRAATFSEIRSIYTTVKDEAINIAVDRGLFVVMSNGDVILNNSTEWFYINYELEIANGEHYES